MTQKLLEQKRLMQRAISTLDSIDELQRVFEKRDPEYFKEEATKRREEYACIMHELFEKGLADAGFKIKEMEVV